jgi:hypothetical protein
MPTFVTSKSIPMVLEYPDDNLADVQEHFRALMDAGQTVALALGEHNEHFTVLVNFSLVSALMVSRYAPPADADAPPVMTLSLPT